LLRVISPNLCRVNNALGESDVPKSHLHLRFSTINSRLAPSLPIWYLCFIQYIPRQACRQQFSTRLLFPRTASSRHLTQPAKVRNLRTQRTVLHLILMNSQCHISNIDERTCTADWRAVSVPLTVGVTICSKLSREKSTGDAV